MLPNHQTSKGESYLHKLVLILMQPILQCQAFGSTIPHFRPAGQCYPGKQAVASISATPFCKASQTASLRGGALNWCWAAC